MAKRKFQRAAEPAPDEVRRAETGALSPALREFSAELAARFPGRYVKRFVMPSVVREASEVFLVELTSRDEIEAAQMADATMSAIERASVRLTNDAEQREAIRLSIVGLGKIGVDKRIAYEHVNADGAPFGELNEWTRRAWTCLHAYFGQMNGVPTDELLEGIRGARTVGAFAPPTSGTPASAADGR
jgi:hypothetical protein